MEWKDILKYGGATGGISAIVLIVLVLNLSGTSYIIPPDEICGDTCFSKIPFNTSYWSICFDSFGDNTSIVTKKSSSSRILWMNLDKINNFLTTKPSVEVYLLTPASLKKDVFYTDRDGQKWRKIKAGDCWKPTKKPNWIGIYGKKDPDQTVKWSISLKEMFNNYIEIDPYWYASSTGLVSFLTFDSVGGSNAEVAKDVFGSNNGIVSGATFTNLGRFNEAYSFDGVNDYITLSNIGQMNLSRGFTISGWINTRNDSGVNSIIKLYSSYTSISLIMQTVGASADWGCRLGNGAGFSDTYSSGTITPKPNTSVWYHCVGVFNGTDFLVYQNGVLKLFDDSNITTNGIVNLSVIGVTGTGNTNYLNGIIDEVMIFNRSLSASEIMDMYTGNKSYNLKWKTDPTLESVDSSLVLYHTMDSRDGSNLEISKDKSIYKNNGIVSGATFTNLGRFREAYKFDGVNDYINLSTVPGLVYDKNFTISGWFYNNGFDTTSNQIIFNQANGTQVYVVQLKNGYVVAGVWNGTNYIIGGQKQSNLICVINRWYHFVYSYTGTSIMSGTSNLWINGVNQTAGTTAQTSVSKGTTIGSTTTGTSIFNGTIDELRVYNHSLTAREVMNLYKGNKTNNLKFTGLVTYLNNSDINLILYYKFDMVNSRGENATDIKDYSIYSNNGTYTGESFYNGNYEKNSGIYTTGRYGNAYFFNGSQGTYKINSSSSSAFNLINKQFSLSFWIYINNTINSIGVGSDDRIEILNLWNTSNTYFRINHQNISTGGILFYFTNQSGSSTSAICSVTMPTYLNKWIHLVITGNSTQLNCYMNGTLRQTTTIGPFATMYQYINNAYFNIGKGSSGYHSLNGSIDELLFYNRTIGADEVSALYNNNTIPRDDLQLRYNFDELNTIPDTKNVVESYDGNGTSAKYGRSVNFDGANGYIQINNFYNLSNFTLSSWIYRKKAGVSDFISRGTHNYEPFKLSIGSTGKVSLQLSFNSTNREFFTDDNTSNQLSLRIWYHIVATFNAPNVSFYINGIKTYTGISNFSSLRSVDGNLLLGKRGDNSNYLNGTLDDVRIYNRTLTDREIKDIYIGTSNGSHLIWKTVPW